MTTTTDATISRKSFRVQFTAWGDQLEAESLSASIDLEGVVRKLENKGQVVALASGKNRIAKTGRLTIWKEAEGELCQQVFEEMTACLLELDEDLRAQFSVEKSRLECQIYYEVASEDHWDVVLSMENLVGLSMRKMELSFGVMP